MNERDDEVWLAFWCGLLAPVLCGEIPESQRGSYFQKASQVERRLPNGQSRKISARTLRRKFQRFALGKVEGLRRKRRSDQGGARGSRGDMLARAVELKREQPFRSHEALNTILRREFGKTIPKTTLYRHLKREGATRLKLGVVKEKVRCRWSREQPDALWVGDFEHGPPVIHEGRATTTRLSAWIDCHSRYIVEARYYLNENLDCLIDSLLRAWGHHGASRELYVDNAKIYHSRALRIVCAELNIRLLHRPPRDPPAGGLIERFFRTAQDQLEAEVRASAALTLVDLNRDLAAWLRIAYHARIHTETRESPQARYFSATRVPRIVDLPGITRYFLRRQTRRVDPTFSDVRVENHFFAVDPAFRNDRVWVIYDAFALNRGELEEVRFESLEGRYLGIGKRYHRQRDFHPSPASPPTKPPIQPHYLEALRAEHAAALEGERSAGLDYHSARQRNIWPLSRFAARFAKLLGRRGGISALTPEELEALAAFHAGHDRVNEVLLEQAFSRAGSEAIPAILLMLQSLLAERND